MDDAGDEFAAIYKAQQRRLVRVAFAITGSLEAAEDAVADAVERCWRRGLRATIDDPQGYLYRAVVNAAIAPARRRTLWLRTQHRVASPATVPPADHLVGDADLVWRQLRSLPAAQRAVLVLRFMEDLTEADTARVLGVSTGTVKSRTSRALAALRCSMEVTRVER